MIGRPYVFILICKNLIQINVSTFMQCTLNVQETKYVSKLYENQTEPFH